MIREFQEQDAERVSELDGQLFPDVCWNEHTIQREARLGWGLVLDEDNEIVGYLLVRIDHELTDIIRIGVAETHQNQGHGRALLQAALKKIPGRAMLQVHQDNYRARRLYLTEGFLPVSMTDSSIMMVREY